MYFEYYRTWKAGERQPRGHLDFGTACALHRKRLPYVAAAHFDRWPQACLRLHGDHIHVSFFDGPLRPYLSSLLTEDSPGMLFLTAATYRTFRGRSRAFAVREDYHFSTDGTVHFQKEHFQDGIVCDDTLSVDVRHHWEPYPEFGDYQSLLALRWVEVLKAI